MAVITPTTFDPLDGFMRVRLGQGVPIVDADVNEREDIAMFEQRAFHKWYAGDGVPEGNGAFRIAESVATKANNFTIVSGVGMGPADALANAGRCLVDGLTVMITADVDFRDQALHASKPTAAALSLKLGSPVIAAMTPAVAPGLVHIWLDVWDTLWTANDDPSLLLPGLGVESCARMKRFWAVRARGSATPPVMGDADFAAGHAYYRIATITRRTGDANANAADIVDMREQRLFLPPSTLAPDLFNVSALDYRRGLGRPPISFRQAINALIRGKIPATVETAIAPAPLAMDTISDGIFFQGNTAVVVWTSDRFGATNQVVATSLDLAAPEATATAATVLQITAGVDSHQAPHAALMRDGRIVVAYEETTGNRDVKLKCHFLASLPGALPKNVASGAGHQRTPLVVPFGALGSERVLVMWLDDTPRQWMFRRYDPTADTFDAPVALSASLTAAADAHAVKDSADTTWVAFQVNTAVPASNTIEVLDIPAGAAPNPGTTLGTADTDKHPFVLLEPSGKPWVFWVSTTGAGVSTIQYSTRNNLGVWSPAAAIPGSPAGAFVNNNPSAIVDADGAIWVFWDSVLPPGGNRDIWYARLDPETGVWTGNRPTTGVAAATDQTAVTLTRGDGVIWLFWNRVLAGSRTELFFQRLITTI
jgi:hypothetical protein